MSLAIAVFASGGGTNLQALLDHFGGAAGGVARIALVVSDRADAGALERARQAGVETRVIAVRGREQGEAGAEMLEALRSTGAELVVLAGYLRLMPPEVVRAYRGRMLNIHPALLPAFGGRGMYGAHIHRAVIEAGSTVSGVTIHFVDERYDTGPILLQWPVPVLPGDCAASLAARVLTVEHRILPLAVEQVARRIATGGTEAGGGPGVASEEGVAGGVGVGGEAGGAGESEREAQGPDRVVFALIDGDAPTEREIRRLLDVEGWYGQGEG